MTTRKLTPAEALVFLRDTMRGAGGAAVKIAKVVKQRGYEAFAIDETRIRFEVSKFGRSWRFHAWDVIGPVTIGKGVERTKVGAIEAALVCLFEMVEKGVPQ